MADPTPPPFLRPLTLPARLALAGLAFIGTAVYASSFALRPLSDQAPRLLPLATGIGLAAGISWMVLGKVLLALAGRSGAKVLMWFDTCLLAMGVGECILIAAAGMNVIGWASGVAPPRGAHLAMLLFADAAMAAVFILRSWKLGVSPALAATLWIAVLNGAFIIGLVLLAPLLGYP